MACLPSLLLVYFIAVQADPTPEGREDRCAPAPAKLLEAAGVHGGIADDVLMENPDCGAVCLYVFLKLFDIPCSLEKIQRDVPLGSTGASMLDLKRVARAHGARAEVVEATPSELFAHLPAIARLASADDIEGHYVVLLSKEEEHVILIDGSSYRLLQFGLGTFERAYSGFAVVVPQAADPTPYLVTLAVVLIAIAVSLLGGRRFGASRKDVSSL